ncbi:MULTISPECIES: hypothetical protein [Bradyrhizobium]|uniref:Uncharacterized protein n=1 Tax=Bradyrhizobium canariense TaxID=255045 RepID=A0A1X3GT47_9BRAD|nr:MULTISPECIES: hypothetical protein [Bradyrhizobium]OSI71591.1 hypothetical protein BSZ22_10890 [Bradyrhizobium canariense]OSI80554.1 hypothetical protein BSZ23_10610 [Bradyrhizobium canariense]OSI91156.1 hypothetical protein BSZ25_16175 [Bradyrhizobium canariense]OSI96905.1 hypothetical protein BSZ24_02915 [Bradyrhizobium canariense]OSJ09207.1 hypothetical protein BSZ16_06805 [Bradyrhizobium canariense]
MSALQDFFAELSKLDSTKLAGVTAFAGATATVVGAIITGIAAKFFVGARDKQDREVEWRKHAIELTKLDLDRKLKTRSPTETQPIRPSILDFLANYRDLQDLDKASPRDLYVTIKAKRIKKKSPEAVAPGGALKPGSEAPKGSEYDD